MNFVYNFVFLNNPAKSGLFDEQNGLHSQQFKIIFNNEHLYYKKLNEYLDVVIQVGAHCSFTCRSANDSESLS